MDWSHVMQIRKARELMHPENTSDETSPARSEALRVADLDACQQMVFRLRSELIDYIEAHGLVDGLIWDGVLQPVDGSKIIITGDMIDSLVERLGFFKKADVEELLETYLPEHDYVKDPNYVHTDNNFSDEHLAQVEKATQDIEDIKQHEGECDQETEERLQGIEGDISEIKSDISGITGEIGSITQSCQVLFDRMGAAEKEITRIDEVVESHSSSIEALQTSVEGLEERVSKNESDILEMDGMINSHADEIDGIKTRLDAAEGSISDLGEWREAVDISQRRQDEQITNLLGRTETNEQNIAALIRSDVDINEHLRQIDRDHKAITQSCLILRDDLSRLEEVVDVNRKESEDTDKLLKAAIQAEAALREEADSELDAKIAKEVIDRTESERVLSEQIASEASAREEADSSIRELLETKEGAINVSINGLQEAINREVSDRTLADRTETEARTLADAEILERISGLSTEINGSISGLGERISENTEKNGTQDTAIAKNAEEIAKLKEFVATGDVKIETFPVNVLNQGSFNTNFLFTGNMNLSANFTTKAGGSRRLFETLLFGSVGWMRNASPNPYYLMEFLGSFEADLTDDGLYRYFAIVFAQDDIADPVLTLIHNNPTPINGRIDRFRAMINVTALPQYPITKKVKIEGRDFLPLLYTPDDKNVHGTMKLAANISDGNGNVLEFQVVVNGTGTTGNVGTPGELLMNGNGTIDFAGVQVPYQANAFITITKRPDNDEAEISAFAELTITIPAGYSGASIEEIMVIEDEYVGDTTTQLMTILRGFPAMRKAIGDKVEATYPGGRSALLLYVSYRIAMNLKLTKIHSLIISEQSMQSVMCVKPTDVASEVVNNTTTLVRTSVPVTTNGRFATNNEVLVDISLNYNSIGNVVIEIYITSNNLLKIPNTISETDEITMKDAIVNFIIQTK